MNAYNIASSILFRFEAEHAHAMGVSLMRFIRRYQTKDPKLRVNTCFGEISNPIGLAGGFDKTGTHLSTIDKLGFGYLIAGTITLNPWPGHPKPRVVRNVSEKTLVNALGFPNPGVDQFILNLKTQKVSVPVVASISGKMIPEIIECYEKIQPHVAAVELNLSSPNTAKLKDLREMDSFRELAGEMAKIKRKPTFLKVPPYLNDERFKKILDLVKLWDQLGFEATTASNAILINEPRVSIGTGGYSGPPLFPNTLNGIREIRKNTSPKFEINAVGGVSSAKDVRDALAAGAKTVQLYTALVYEGPFLIRNMLKELSASGGLNQSQPDELYQKNVAK